MIFSDLKKTKHFSQEYSALKGAFGAAIAEVRELYPDAYIEDVGLINLNESVPIRIMVLSDEWRNLGQRSVDWHVDGPVAMEVYRFGEAPLGVMRCIDSIEDFDVNKIDDFPITNWDVKHLIEACRVLYC